MWGLYRNQVLSIGDSLRKGASELWPQFYLEVCYIDLNGPNNVGKLNVPKLAREFPPFNPRSRIYAFLAPGILDRLRRWIEETGQDEPAIKRGFLVRAQRVHDLLHLPLGPEAAWEKLWRALKRRNR